jgi:hypothetical protein
MEPRHARVYTHIHQTNLPEGYEDAHPLALNYVELSDYIVIQIGNIASYYFDIYGWNTLTERAYLLGNGNLLLEIIFHEADEIHYLEIPKRHWQMNCVTTV